MADQGTEGLLSPYLRKKRIAAVRPFLRGRVLDVGCGSGALAAELPPDRYLGFDPDEESIAIAKEAHAGHRFVTSLAEAGGDFNTIVSLAVIEHIEDPGGFLREQRDRLGTAEGDSIVCTTPHPAVDWVHTLGASIGLFSAHASEEHEQLLDRDSLAALAEPNKLVLAGYKRFLFGANQLAVYKRVGTAN
jgi:2-polyprenyl-3-methyl-5-hydroxy-6-metoxy-1,4-benzoquinol methylase